MLCEQNNAVKRSRYAANAAVLLRKDTPFSVLQEELEMLHKMHSILTHAVIKEMQTTYRAVKGFCFINANARCVITSYSIFMTI